MDILDLNLGDAVFVDSTHLGFVISCLPADPDFPTRCRMLSLNSQWEHVITQSSLDSGQCEFLVTAKLARAVQTLLGVFPKAVDKHTYLSWFRALRDAPTRPTDKQLVEACSYHTYNESTWPKVSTILTKAREQ